MCSWYVFNIVNTCSCYKQTRHFYFNLVSTLHLTQFKTDNSDSQIMTWITNSYFLRKFLKGGCLESLWHLPHWRHSKALWTQSGVTCSRTPCLSKEVGPDNPQCFLPKLIILWFCGREEMTRRKCRIYDDDDEERLNSAFLYFKIN